MGLRGVWVVTALVLLHGTNGQVCNWDWGMDTAQALDPESLVAGARTLSVLRDVRDMEHCQKACCSESACQIAMIGTPADGSPECWLVSCLQDGRDVCLLQPSSQFKVYRKKTQAEEEPEQVEQQNATETPQQPHDARSVSEENSTNADLCRRPMMVGSCQAFLPRFYYDVTKQSCQKFVYGGCEDNGNNFQSLAECEEACQGVQGPVAQSAPRSFLAPLPPQPAEDPVPRSSDVSLPEISEDDFAHRCGVKPVVGPCRAALPRWFYNSSTRACQSFIYGGCRGNHNNYGSQENCMTACTVTVLPSPRKSEDKLAAMETKDYNEYCLAPPERGPCRAAFPQFYYHPSSASCSSFTYGGCRGNKNRYDTMADCMSQCETPEGAQGNVGKRDRWTPAPPAIFPLATLAVIAVLVLAGLILITLHRTRVTRRARLVSDKEELLPQQGEHSSVGSLSLPESPKVGKV